MDRLLIKSYELILKIPMRFFFVLYHKELVLRYEQAKLIDTIEFFKITEEGGIGIIQRLLQFVREHGHMDKRVRKYVMQNREKLFFEIKRTFFDGCFAEGKEGTKKGEDSPFSSYITILSEKLNIDPISLIKNYTPKQLEYLTEGLVWNANEQTKDGKKKNRLRLTQQKAVKRTDEDKEKIKGILSKLS